MLPLVIIGLGIAVCVYGSHFFSSSEMSFSSASIVRLEHESEKRSRAKMAIYIIEHFDDALSAILIGNNLVNIAASSLTSVFMILLTGTDEKTWIGTLVITIVIIIFGETIAKIAAKKMPNTLALEYALPIRVLMFVFYPIVYVVVIATKFINSFVKGSEAEDGDEQVEAFQSIIETAEDEGVLTKDRTELLQAAIDFSEKSAVEVMTSRVDLEAFDIDDSFEELMDLVKRTNYSRIPVYRDSVDNVIGVVRVDHILKALSKGDKDINVASLMLPPYFVYKTMLLPQVLNQMRRAKQHLAIVTDEYGGTLGVITMEDVLEEIVGEIWDETDKVEEEVVEKNNHEYVIDGDMNLGDFFELVDLEEYEDDFESETVGGWTIEVLGHYPRRNQRIEYKNLLITVLAVSDRRVERVLANRTDLVKE